MSLKNKKNEWINFDNVILHYINCGYSVTFSSQDSITLDEIKRSFDNDYNNRTTRN